ncbi:hypothetical protein L1987_02129 [Smallanthus sonchifolius]|uniref:Uncharacterized protein n=1 Tax=Smallanthus sonchifolius TaxID=185202 RepID=A0ACB9K767_9ASTR|nr:hypothetical protein L1987_02129 [Smallanthus sonchifolius]
MANRRNRETICNLQEDVDEDYHSESIFQSSRRLTVLRRRHRRQSVVQHENPSPVAQPENPPPIVEQEIPLVVEPENADDDSDLE